MLLLVSDAERQALSRFCFDRLGRDSPLSSSDLAAFNKRFHPHKHASEHRQLLITRVERRPQWLKASAKSSRISKSAGECDPLFVIRAIEASHAQCLQQPALAFIAHRESLATRLLSEACQDLTGPD